MHIERPASKQPMPESAKLVFKGVLFDVYHWEQELFNGSFRTFEKLKRNDASVIIPVTADGKILVTYQEQSGRVPYTALPGGHLDSGEDPLDAAKRELLEETGYASETWSLFEAIQPTSKIDWAIYFFVARDCKPIQEVAADGGEKIRTELLSFEQFLDFARRPDFAERDIKFRVFEALLDSGKMSSLKKQIFG